MVEYLRDWLIYFNFGWVKIVVSLAVIVIFSVASLLAARAILILLPRTYFCDLHPRDLWINRHPIIRWVGIILKNLAGALLVMLGLVLTMPGIPGPGAMTIVIGALLLDFPGKRRLERRLISHPRILASINRLRAKYGKPPLILDTTECARAFDPTEFR